MSGFLCLENAWVLGWCVFPARSHGKKSGTLSNQNPITERPEKHTSLAPGGVRLFGRPCPRHLGKKRLICMESSRAIERWGKCSPLIFCHSREACPRGSGERESRFPFFYKLGFAPARRGSFGLAQDRGLLFRQKDPKPFSPSRGPSLCSGQALRVPCDARRFRGLRNSRSLS